MRTLVINGALYADMIRCGAANLAKKKEIVNELNVFPVPDGDTGDNMSMTINSAANSEDIDDPVSLGQVSAIVMHDSLLGARGNSGVILSRIFAGIARGLENKIEASVSEFSYAMELGAKEAYAAVANPIEGTILTVLKDGIDYAKSRIMSETTFEQYFEYLTSEMRRSVENTPELLPSLKEAGVVDSGGVGLLYIFEGMQRAFEGKEIDLGFLTKRKNETEEFDISLFTEDSKLEFGYCTEFLLRLQNQKIAISDFSINNFTDYLKSIGDSVVCFQNDSIVKVHIHSKRPGDIFNYCQNFGEFLKIKVENMSLQHNNTIIRNAFDNFKTKPHKKYGIVTVASGEGIIDTFSKLGCDIVIPGGQSMNPSTNDFLRAFDEINADTIFVFPNNKNIIMAAKQAASVTTKDVRIVETKTIGEGYAAISMFDANIESPDNLVKDLNAIISETVTGLVSKASRNVKINDININADDYIGFSNKTILCSEKNCQETLIGLAKKLHTEHYDIVILFYGDNIKPSDAEELQNILKKQYDRQEFYLIDGGQPVYDYILILE